MYRMVTATPLGHEAPEERDPNRTVEQVVSQLAAENTPAASVASRG
jgi:hypothetical protein